MFILFFSLAPVDVEAAPALVEEVAVFVVVEAALEVEPPERADETEDAALEIAEEAVPASAAWRTQI
jgi:hypothetical protein